MVTLRQFKALAQSYGADLQRWPDTVRPEAEALLAASPEARAMLAAERVLDEAIGAAQAQRDAALWPPGADAAALARLRSGVAARIAPPPGRYRSAPGWGARAVSVLLGRTGLAACGGTAVVVGLLLGALYNNPAPSQPDVLAMLRPVPLPILAQSGSQDD